MSVKMKYRIKDIPNIWYTECLLESKVLLSAAYDLADKRLYLKYIKDEQWFLYENVPAKWWRDFTMAEDKDAFVKATRKEALKEKSRIILLI